MVCMTKDVTARERSWTDTQQWLNDLDRGEPGADFDGAAIDLGDITGVEHSDAPPPAGLGAADGDDDELDYGITNDDDRPAHIDAAPVDLDQDSAEPNPADRSADAPDPADHPDPAPATHTGAVAAAPAQPAEPTTAGEKNTARPPRYNKKIAAGFAVVTMLAALAVSGALLAMRSGPPTADPDHTTHPSTQVSVLAAPTTSAPATGDQDSPIPYTATSVGCLPGSTAAQSVAGPDSTQAWVCVTGGNIGQYLVLNLGRSMVITAVSITPGWVGADPSGADQWHQHRVLTRVQWSFNDSPPTVVPQDTGSVHGEATKPMPAHGVLASRIIVLVQETARAPADAPPTTSPVPGGSGPLGDVLGPSIPAEPAPTGTTAVLPGLPADPSHTDPADNTFAVSSIKVFGHPPQ